MRHLPYFTSLAGMVLLSACSDGKVSTAENNLAKPMIDITPVGGLGQVMLRMPPAANIPAGYTITLNNQSATSATPASILVDGVLRDKIYNLRTGPFCIIINGPYHQQKRCGFQVQPNTLKNIDLGVFAPTWDVSKFKVDLGPKAAFSMEDSNAVGNPLHIGRLDDPNKVSRTFLLLAGPIQTKYKIPNIYAGEPDKTIEIAPLAVTFADIAPSDRRATIELTVPTRKFKRADFINLDGYLCIADSTFIASYYKSPEPILNSPDNIAFTPSYPLFSNYADSSVIPTTLYSAPTTTTFSYKAYPYVSGPDLEKFYAINVNNMMQKINLTAGAATIVNMEHLNISNINAITPGFFKLYELADDAASPGGWKIKREHMPFLDNYLKTGYYIPTASVVHVIPGRRYKFDSFLKDDGGNYIPQSSQIIDLR